MTGDQFPLPVNTGRVDGRVFPLAELTGRVSSAIFNVSWQMTTDSETTEQYLTFVRSRFLISILVFVSRELRNGVTLIQFANAFSIVIAFARWRKRSESTTSPVQG